jgi:signal transduction histidine kinase
MTYAGTSGDTREMLSTMDEPRTVELQAIVEAAHANALQAVVELRGLVGRIHPPVLDAGLEPALSSIVDSLALPVKLHVELAQRPPFAIETILYFCATELLANVVKHSGASAATVAVTGDRRRVRLTVTDNGVGGARVDGGSGLRGLATPGIHSGWLDGHRQSGGRSHRGDGRRAGGDVRTGGWS